MKTIAFLALVSALGLVSCQKTYICECEETYDPDFHAFYSEDIIASKKNKQSKCDKYMGETYKQYPGSTFTCNVK